MPSSPAHRLLCIIAALACGTTIMICSATPTKAGGYLTTSVTHEEAEGNSVSLAERQRHRAAACARLDHLLKQPLKLPERQKTLETQQSLHCASVQPAKGRKS